MQTLLTTRGPNLTSTQRWGRIAGLSNKANFRLAMDYFQRVDLFRDLTREERHELFKGVEMKACPPGAVLFAPEDSSERVFILKEGQVVLYRLAATGKRLVIRRVEPVTVFGEMGLLGQSMHGCFAESTSKCVLCVATKEQVMKALERPGLALRLLTIVGERMKLLEERLEREAFGTVRSRLAEFLLANMDRETGAVAGYSHEEIGDTIGAVRQTVTEALSELEGEGLVMVGRKHICVLDRARLEDAALGAANGLPEERRGGS